MKAIIGIGKYAPERAMFKKWLRGKGYDARLKAESSYNGVDIRKDSEAKARWRELWYEFEVDMDI